VSGACRLGWAGAPALALRHAPAPQAPHPPSRSSAWEPLLTGPLPLSPTPLPAPGEFTSFNECCSTSFNRTSTDAVLGDGATNFNCYVAPNVTLAFDDNGTVVEAACFKPSNSWPVMLCDQFVCHNGERPPPADAPHAPAPPPCPAGGAPDACNPLLPPAPGPLAS
jgi:hypothetical protein